MVISNHLSCILTSFSILSNSSFQFRKISGLPFSSVFSTGEAKFYFYLLVRRSRFDVQSLLVSWLISLLVSWLISLLVSWLISLLVSWLISFSSFGSFCLFCLFNFERRTSNVFHRPRLRLIKNTLSGQHIKRNFFPKLVYLMQKKAILAIGKVQVIKAVLQEFC